jgi:hypothetical protein
MGTGKESMTVTTVVTRSHLGDARVLASMLRRWNPGARCLVLVVDAGREDVKGLGRVEGMECVALEELGLPDERAFCFQYSAFELCNALKPWFMRWVRQRSEGAAIVHLDSDVGVFASLEDFIGWVRSCDVLLTPHVTVDYPADGCIPKRRILGFVGVYNAGVVGVGPGEEGMRFLDWWAGETLHGALDAPSDGMFADQKSLDFVPSLFPGSVICRHPGVNLGHFNLHARRLERRGAEWWVEGERLLLGHFTSVDYERLEFLPPLDRPLIRQQPLVKEWLREYAEERKRNGAGEDRKLGYGLARFTDGTPILPATRRVFRQAWLAGRPSGDPFKDPHWIRFNRCRLPFVRAMGVWNRWVYRSAAFLKGWD